MCEHTRRPKLFCILQSCQKSQCCACITCLKHQHNHASEHYLDQKQISYLLSRFDPPAAFKEERKNTTLKMYKFLTKLKSEISSKIEEMIADLMSKVKYPYLYQAQMLDNYRNLRDKNYQRLHGNTFKLFCRTARNLSAVEFIDKEKEYYNLYLQETHEKLQGFPEKVRNLEKTFGFQLGSDVINLHSEYMGEVQAFKNKHKVSRSLEKKEHSVVKEKNPLNGSMKLEKKKMDFLTPTKPTVSLDISIDSMSFQSSGESRLRKQSESLKVESKDNQLSFELDRIYKRTNTSQEQKNIIKVPQISDTNTVKSSQQNKNQDSPLKMIPKLKMNDLYNYEDQISNNYKIKITDTTKDDSCKKIMDYKYKNDDMFSTSIELEPKVAKPEHGRKMSYHEQMLSMSIKDREEFIKTRISQMKSNKNCQDVKDSLRESAKLKKDTTNSSKKVLEFNPISNKKSPSKVNDGKNQVKNVSSLVQSVSLDKKINHSITISKKESKSPKKQAELSLADHKTNFASNNSSQNNKKSPKKSTNNVSLGKQFVHHESQKSSENIYLHFRNANKEIPINQNIVKEAPPPRRLLKKKSFEITQDQELDASAVLVAKLQEMKNPVKIIQFLEKYSGRFENCLSAVQYLSFLYLEQGRHKDCITLTTKYLQQLDYLKVADLQKVNLAINRSAALNQLGRYSETISLLTRFEMTNNSKVHKNMGDALFNLGTIDRAIYQYQKATTLDERYDEAYYNLAVILYMQENFFHAQMNIEKAIRSQPKNATYLQLEGAIKERILQNCN